MRKFFVSGLVSLALFASVSSTAQAQCLLCGTVGFALGSSTSAHASLQDVSAGSGGAVLYVAPRISERINDPLGVHIAVSDTRRFSMNRGDSSGPGKGMTIQQIFNITVKEADRYIVLEVMRVINPNYTNVAVFWFAYLEKEKVTPLDKLPTTAKTNKK
jgi:hypothetical protein